MAKNNRAEVVAVCCITNLTLGIWVFAQFFYRHRHRQRRWKILLHAERN